MRGWGLGPWKEAGDLTPSLPPGAQEGAGVAVHADGKQGEVPGIGLLSQFASPPGRRGTALMRLPWF